ncbi:glycosyltransferase family 4 protein [Fulvivirga kasyanovii]
MPDFGWKPFVYTPENPSFEVKDYSLEKDISPEIEVIKLPIWEPYKFIQRFKGKGSQQSDIVKSSNKGLLSKIMLWLRGNLFIPDPRCFWIKPSVKRLSTILASKGIDTIITTGPPHSIHLIGLKLKQKLNVKWIADFRDPWTTWVLYESFYLTGVVRRIHRKMEKEVLTHADSVLAASWHYAKELSELGGGRDVEVITNGFDDDEFNASAEINPKEFVIRHVGVVDELRDPTPFLNVVKSLIVEEDYNINVEFVGNVNQALRSYIASDMILNERVLLKPYVSHDQVFEIYRSSAALLLVPFKNMPGNIPGKLFEYLASGRPILAIGPKDSDSSLIIEQAKAGLICEPDNAEAMKEAIRHLYLEFKAGQKHDFKGIQKFSRRKLTEKLANILNNL